MDLSSINFDELRFESFEGDLRQRFPSEVNDLAPWIRENLASVGAAIGMEGLVFVERESRAGHFRVDILATDEKAARVLIELQHGPSDHRHFGQIVLYACERSANVIVWLVAGSRSWSRDPVRGEHRRALRILNEKFAGVTQFYAIELTFQSEPRLLSESEAPLLPKLTVVVQPEQ